jgi:hypothetical protein
MLVPNLTSNTDFPAKNDTPVSAVALPMGAAPAPAGPQRVALAPLATPALAPPPPVVEPRSPAPDTLAPKAVPSRPAATQPAVRAAVRQPTTGARPAAPVRQVRTTKATAASARVITAATGCPSDSRIARDLCEVQQCRRADLRNTPVCTRILAEQRAALARLRGTPD